MALALSAQTIISREWSAADGTATAKIGRQSAVQHAAGRAHSLFNLLGPAYKNTSWGTAFGEYVLAPQRLMKMSGGVGALAPYPDSFLLKWGLVGRKLGAFQHGWECAFRFKWRF